MNGLRTRHLRHDVYVCAHLSQSELEAAWCGGLVDCVTVLAEAGLRVPAHATAETHLRLARGDTRAAGRRHEYAPTSHMHWSRMRTAAPSRAQCALAARAGSPVSRLRVPIREALRQAMTTCLSYEESAAVIEEMVGRDVCPVDDVAHAIAVAPHRVARALAELDAIPPGVDNAFAALRSGHLR